MTSLRLSLGLFTIIPVGRVGDVDSRRARGAMLWAPAIGALLGAMGAVIVWAVHALVPTAPGSLLAATLGIGALAYLTRALHLDGLADTTDALGSGKPAQEALAIARGGDIGPFGVVALALALLLQVTALAIATDAGTGALALVLAAATGRLAAVLACVRGVPAARPEGLGALVAGIVPRGALAAWTFALLLASAAAGAWLTPDAAWTWPLAVVVGLAVASLLVRRAVRRLGGVTGDVMGASVEVATTAALLTAALTSTVGA